MRFGCCVKFVAGVLELLSRLCGGVVVYQLDFCM